MKNPLPLYLRTPHFGERIQKFVQAKVLDQSEVSLIDFIAFRYQESRPEVLLALALALRAPRSGHVGVVLTELPQIIDVPESDDPIELDWPKSLESWQTRVLESNAVGGTADVQCPFVKQKLDSNRMLLMTRRMWQEQERLAAALLNLNQSQPSFVLPEAEIEKGIDTLFDGKFESQGAYAVRTASKRCFTVVTGGPGTGKTYSIKRLLALLLEAASEIGAELKVALAAPTGKAAVRMKDAIAEELEELNLRPDVFAHLSSLEPTTLHRMIVIRPDGTCRHNQDNPIDADLIVVDEASMIDLVNMRRLCEATPSGARLVLLGDRDQLASVEAGTVLADIVGPVLDGHVSNTSSLAQAVVHFETNHRFAKAPTISDIAEGLQRRDDEKVLHVVDMMMGRKQAEQERLLNRIQHISAPEEGKPDEKKHYMPLAVPYLEPEGYLGVLCDFIRTNGVGRPLEKESIHIRLLAAFEKYRILAVHRRGLLGVQGLQRWLETYSKSELTKSLAEFRNKDQSAVQLPSKMGLALGMPILITENSPDVGLMNGDVGLILPSNGQLAAVFPIQREGNDSTRVIPLARLPNHSGAFCMTVHKSQGSQFERVALVLAGRDSPIQTRELIYTAITRSKSLLDWLGLEKELDTALRRRVIRASGLSLLLWLQ